MLRKKRTFRKYTKNEDGNVAIISAFVIPVILFIGMAGFDYSLAVGADKDLKASAAAAALAAVNEAQVAHKNNENVDLKKLMEETAKSVFEARMGSNQHIDITELKITPSQIGNTLTTDVAYSAKYNTKAMNIVGQSSYKIADSQRATVSSAQYINIALVFDASASMGVGATEQDQILMQNNTNCTFACHGTSYDRARNLGATMRIDVARVAAADSIQVIKNNIDTDDQVSVGIYRYGGDVTQILDFKHPQATNLDFVKQKIQTSIFLQPSNAGTDTEGALDEVAALLPDSGTGRTAEDRVQYIVVLTDGVEDYRHGGSYGKRNLPTAHGVWAPGTSGCQAIRDRGINIFFVQTEYLTPKIGRHQNIYSWIDGNLNPILDNRFATCSGSMDNVFQTSTPRQIQKAFVDVMGDISAPLRLF